MAKQKRYYRTAALLGPHTQQVALRPKRRALRIRIPWRIILPLLLVAGLGLWIALDDLWFLMPDDVSVTGVESYQAKAEIIIASDLLGWHRFGLRPRAAEQAVIEQKADLKEADVTCALFPTKCRISVVMREPVLAWFDGATTYWVDKTGVMFEAQDVRSDLPVVQGPTPRSVSQPMTPILEGVASLVELGLPAHGLEYNPQRGLIWVDPEGRRIAFGVGADMSTRWRLYEELLGELKTRGIFPSTMDVRFPRGVTYSLERSW